MAEPISAEAKAHWARVRASIPSDFFKYTKPLEVPRITVTDSEVADVETFKRMRRAVIGDSTKASGK